MEKPKVGDLNRKKIATELDEDVYESTIKDAIDSLEDKRDEIPKSRQETLVEKQFDEMLSLENLEMKTELSNVAIIELSRAEVILEKFNIPALKTFTDYYKRHCVSRKRKGREEIVKLTTNSNAGIYEDDMSMFEKTKARLM